MVSKSGTNVKLPMSKSDFPNSWFAAASFMETFVRRYICNAISDTRDTSLRQHSISMTTLSYRPLR